MSFQRPATPSRRRRNCLAYASTPSATTRSIADSARLTRNPTDGRSTPGRKYSGFGKPRFNRQLIPHNNNEKGPFKNRNHRTYGNLGSFFRAGLYQRDRLRPPVRHHQQGGSRSGQLWLVPRRREDIQGQPCYGEKLTLSCLVEIGLPGKIPGRALWRVG